MNWDLIITTAGMLLTILFFSPFYLALVSAYVKMRSKTEIEFVAVVAELQKKNNIDDAIERMFEGDVK